MAPQLIKMEGDTQGKAYSVTKASMVIGRADNADIVLTSKFASRTHAELHYSDGIYTLYIPEGKAVQLNGVKVEGQHRINPGDIIDFPEERFTFGELRQDTGAKKEAPKADPVRLLIYALPVIGLIAFAYLTLTASTPPEAPGSAAINVENLKVLTAEHPELYNLSRDVFYRGDYVSALNRLNTEVGSSLNAEQRKQVKDVILELVRRKIANQFADGRDHFTTQQWEAARTNFNTVVRLEVIFDADSKKDTLPAHPRLHDAAGNPEIFTVEQALEEAKDSIARCDAVLEGRKDPGAKGGQQAENAAG